MRMYDIIEKKRNGGELNTAEIEYFISGIVDGTIPDYQTASLCMAIYFKGMSNTETAVLTDAMAKSGEMIDLSGINGITTDKHSTGGVGDKTTLIVAPIVAAAGGKVAKMSGRGLGHTGGTIDKLESIPGFSTSLDEKRFFEQVNKIGLSVIGHNKNLAPADGVLYSLRDVTATVDCIPLIASSIMSKKLAAGCNSIVLDVKTGSGAFMKTLEKSEELAKAMVKIGMANGRKTTALITNMDCPLGKTIGNNLEVKEAIEVLNGNGSEDLKEVSFSLAAAMIESVKNCDFDEAYDTAKRTVADGSALAKLKEMVKAQGGKTEYIENPNLFENAKFKKQIFSTESGFIKHMDTEKIGIVSSILGAGREKIEDSVDYTAGIVLEKKTAEKVNKGDLLATLYTNIEEKINESADLFISSIEFSETEIKKPKMVIEKIN